MAPWSVTFQGTMRGFPAITVMVCASAIAACKATPRGDATSSAPATTSESPGEAPAPPPSLTTSQPDPVRAPPEGAREPRVVLVTIDGVRWQDVFGGGDPGLTADGQLDAYADPLLLVPRLSELAAGGVAFGDTNGHCNDVRTHGTSNFSLPGYLEILGARATSCVSNGCARAATPSVLDDAARAGITAASISSWELLERAATDGSSDVFVSSGARVVSPRSDTSAELVALLESGRRVGPFPGPAGTQYRPDAMTAAIALEYLRAKSPRFLHVGLGDTDEWAHRGNYIAYLRALHDADTFVGDVLDLLRERGLHESTTLIVTTDHGRASDFRGHASARSEARHTFLFAYGPRTAEPGSRCASRDIELPDVGATIRRLLELPPREGAEDGKPISEIAGE